MGDTSRIGRSDSCQRCPAAMSTAFDVPRPLPKSRAAPRRLGAVLGVEIPCVTAITRVDGGFAGFDQGEIEVLSGVAEDFGDDAPVAVAVLFADADLLRDDPAQIVVANDANIKISFYG